MHELNNIDKAFILKKISLFSNLDLDVLIAIADKAVPLTLNINDEIFHKDQEAHQMYFIIAGTVSITSEGDFKTLKQGLFFGEESVFNEKPRSYNAKCLTDCQLLTISKGHLLTIIYEFPSVALQLLKQLYI